MSLPPGFLDELRARVPLARVVGRRVTWDMRKSNQGKGDWWAPCPFHQEKSASFHVDDRKGFYHCFGCQASGDAIKFLREIDGLGFMEAVEALAGEAGMQMPARDPRAAESAARRQGLADVMEMAVQHYALSLRGAKGAAARTYLAGRGLDDAAARRWDLGWAADEWDGLSKALLAKGVTPEQLRDAGLTAASDRGGADYDRFRGRILFPIRDARGRCIAFGGRSMDPKAQAKYLNSPQTDLFDKGRTLYNIGPARDAVGTGEPLIVAEGYMDVIALAEAGLTGAVAPLGTAITEEQLALLWRLSPVPVVALDGDGAGLRAAYRLIDLALPQLAPDRSLRFALMPGGMDPDELIRAEGAGAMRAAVEAAVPLVDLLWRRETEGKDFAAPEARAALDRALRAAVGRIGDPDLRRHTGEALRDRTRALWSPSPRAGGGRDGRRWGSPPPVAPMAGTLGSPLGAGAVAPDDALREAVLALLVVHPALVADLADRLDHMDCPRADHRAVRDALLAGVGDRTELEARLGAGVLGRTLARAHILSVGRAGDIALARRDAVAALDRLEAMGQHRVAVDEAVQDIAGRADEWLTRRLGQAAAAVDTTKPAHVDDVRDVVVAPNGVPIDRGEKARADEVFGAIDYKVRRGRRIEG